MPSILRGAGALLLLAALLPACRQQEAATTPAAPDSNGSTPVAADSTFTASGTIHRVKVEGGCWRFDLEDGRHFELLAGADSSLLADGRRTTLTLRARPDLMSLCQIGPIAEVLKGP